MFDQCNPEARAVIDDALGEARRLGHHHLGTEHLLLALVGRRDLLPRRVAALLPDAHAVRSALASPPAGPPPRDADLLATVGVDLGQVRAAVRETFGNDAIERLARRRVHQPWQPWRRPSRRCTSLLGDRLQIAPRVKQALASAARHAHRHGASAVGTVALLAGIVDVEGAKANGVLRSLGVDPSDLRRALDDTDH